MYLYFFKIRPKFPDVIWVLSWEDNFFNEIKPAKGLLESFFSFLWSVYTSLVVMVPTLMSEVRFSWQHMYQSLWHLRFWLMIDSSACTQTLWKFCPAGFQVHFCSISGAAYGLGSKGFGLPFTQIYWSMAAMFFDLSGSFVVELCT